MLKDIMAGLFALAFLVSLVLFPLGLIRPSLFSRFLPNSRKIQSLVFGGIFLFSSIIVGATSPTPTPTTQNVQDTKKEVRGTSASQVPTASVEKIEPTQLPTSTPTQVPTATPKSRPTNTPVQIVPTSTPAPIASAPAAVSQTIGSGYSCDCGKTCGQISSCDEAYFQLLNCGCSVRDGDDDGVPCEEIC